MAKVLDVVFVGAGAINFGGAEGPWDHATRLEKLGGVRVVALVEPDTKKAEDVISKRRAGAGGELYKDCVIYKSVEQFLKEGKADAMFLGIPPNFRGSPEAGRSLELDVINAGIHLFVEKPLSVAVPEAFSPYPGMIKQAQEKTKTVMSVGYMFRYHAAVLKMKELIKAHGGKVMACNMRYYTAYTEMDHVYWWNKTLSGGPIVEQATHFCDLARFLVGDVDLETLQVQCLKDTTPGGAGKLSRVVPACEQNVAPEDRVPRVTMATWHFKDAGLGNLTHLVGLHGKQYETHLEVVLDGLRVALVEPYTTGCHLKVRDGKSGSDDDVIYNFGDDDPYEREIWVFLDAVRSGSDAQIASTYEDAAKTYELTWAIRRKCEQ